MNVKAIDNNLVSLGQFHDLRKLIYGDPELGVDVAGGNFIIAPRHNVRVETHPTRITVTVFLTKLLQHRQVVEIDVHPEVNTLNNFVKFNTIWREGDLIRHKSSPQGQFGLVDRHHVRATSMLFQKLQN